LITKLLKIYAFQKLHLPTPGDLAVAIDTLIIQPWNSFSEK